MMRAGWIAAGVVALLAVTVVQLHRLEDSPAYINLDEAHFGNHAYSLAKTGRDLNGSRLPLFISLEDPLGDRPVLPWGTTWYHPFGFYVIASSLVFMPLSESSIRAPIAMIGVLNVALMFLVARRWYKSRTAGVIAAALLAMTPAHFIISRLAMDYLLPLPFTLAWLLALSRLIDLRTRHAAIGVGLILGLGCYSFVSSWFLMPVFMAISLLVVVRQMRARELLAPIVTAFAIAMIPLAAWLIAHPQMPANLVAQYRVGGTARSAQAVISAYWNYFNPSFLFVNGGASRLISTGQIGVWPIGAGVLLAITLVRAIVTGSVGSAAILIAGVLIAPLPAALKGNPFDIQRAITMLPFGVLLAAGAVTWPRRRLLVTAVVALACISVPYQFVGFLRDYFGDYRLRAARVIDPTSFRETANALVTAAAATDVPEIVLPTPLYDVSAKWRFYATARGRADLLQRTRYYSGSVSDVHELRDGSLVVVETAHSPTDGQWRVVAAPKDINGNVPLQVIRR